jgi:hypothetical protein
MYSTTPKTTTPLRPNAPRRYLGISIPSLRNPSHRGSRLNPVAATLRFRLRPGFREPISSGVGFVGREAEVARLLAIIKHRPAATVLVSGHRGVGKTTLVDEALRRSETEKLLVIRLSLPHVYPGEEGTSRDVRGQVLRSLARSLHFTVKENKHVPADTRRRAQELYDKTYLRELHEQGQLESLTGAETRQSTTTREELSFDPGPVVQVLLGSAGSAFAAGAAIGVSALVGANFGTPLGVASFLAVAVAAIVGGIAVRRVSSEESSATSKVLEQRTAARIGTFDLSPETLEFELQELLTDLRANGARAVFIIDELDKLEVAANASALEEHLIFSIISSLKNFFTMGSGIFIFISGEDFYARLEESIETDTYSLAHTLFTDRVFVHVLPYPELERLIDGLLAEKPQDDSTYRRFRNYLCWESRSHVFDLLSILGDYVGEYENDSPIVVAHESYEADGRWHEGNLPDDWILAASMQKIVGATYDEATRPGGRRERFNQALWLTLLSTAKEVVSDGYILVPKRGFDLESISWTSWTEHLRDNDIDDIAGAVDRLLARGERYGILTTTETTISEDDAEEIGGEPGEIPAIEYAVTASAPYPDASVGTHSAPSPFEEGFLSVVDALDVVYDNLKQTGLDLEGYDNEVEKCRAVARAVRTRPVRKSPPRSEVRSALQSADALLPRLLDEGIVELIRDWAEDHDFDWITDLDSQPVQSAIPASPPTVSLGEFERLRPVLVENDVEFGVITTPERENQILVLVSVSPEAARKLHSAYKEASPGRKGQDRRVQRLPVVEVRRTPPETPIELPSEVITEVEENPSRSFVSWMASLLSTGSKVKQVSSHLAGWNIFRLDPDGANIADIQEILSSVSFLSADE